MRELEFPIIGTKVKGLTRKFDLNSPEGRKKYFQAKAGDEIGHINKYLSKNSFIAYLLGKKQAGKGTYSKLLTEIFGENKIEHVSVGDVVRGVDDWKKFIKTDKYQRMKSYYRGFTSFDDAVKTHLNRSTKGLISTEFVLALLKAHIDELQGKSIFLDGLPRNLDQISYSLFFRDVINYRDDPDIFILIDIPEEVIEERMKYRVVCPKCQTARNLKLLPTSKVRYDSRENEFYLACDNTNCKGARMIAKEGDEKGLGFIRERLNNDEELIRTAFKLHGVPKILLRNHVPVKDVEKHFDDYEITPEYSFKWDSTKKRVRVIEKPWIIKDDNGTESYSLLAPPVVISMIKQMVEVLNI